jgi:hypothetical protein
MATIVNCELHQGLLSFEEGEGGVNRLWLYYVIATKIPAMLLVDVVIHKLNGGRCG